MGDTTKSSTGTRPEGFRRFMPIPAPPASSPRPALTQDEARAKLEQLQAHDHEGVSVETRTVLYEPDGGSDVTLVAWHGFTNAPTQFAAIAERFRLAGVRVLLPRMPYHGHADVLNRELEALAARELVDHVDACIDIAAGLGRQVWVLGLSAGAVLAAWAAATRSEVDRLVLAAPLVAPKGFPMPLVRLFVRFPGALPQFYMWWDPRKKADLGESPHAYPGFPVRGILPFLHLSEALYDRQVPVDHPLRRVVLLSNPGDFAIRRDAARSFAWHVFDEHADYLSEASLDGGLGWWHDFVDPMASHGGTTEEVAPIFFATLGIGGDPSAGGKLVAPLPSEDPL